MVCIPKYRSFIILGVFSKKNINTEQHATQLSEIAYAMWSNAVI